MRYDSAFSQGCQQKTPLKLRGFSFKALAGTLFISPFGRVITNHWQLEHLAFVSFKH